jgi:hypothetical protein
MGEDTESTIKSYRSGHYYGRYVPTSNGKIAGPHVIRPEHRMIVRAGNPFNIIGNLPLDDNKFMLGSFGGVLKMSHVIEDFERVLTEHDTFRLKLLPIDNLIHEDSPLKG